MGTNGFIYGSRAGRGDLRGQMLPRRHESGQELLKFSSTITSILLALSLKTAMKRAFIKAELAGTISTATNILGESLHVIKTA